PGSRWLWPSGSEGRAKAPIDSLALAWPSLSHGPSRENVIRLFTTNGQKSDSMSSSSSSTRKSSQPSSSTSSSLAFWSRSILTLKSSSSSVDNEGPGSRKSRS
ncbi:hypothetical protein K503DRAFT_809409, partial [Rhizopogon vinicolor AM-OR11-026]